MAICDMHYVDVMEKPSARNIQILPVRQSCVNFAHHVAFKHFSRIARNEYTQNFCQQFYG